MKLSQFIAEDFANYKCAAMFLGTTKCSGKCYKELGLPCETCQNYALQLHPENFIEFNSQYLVRVYTQNAITRAVVIGGLEPLDTFDEVLDFMKAFRAVTDDTIVIYTGYEPDEIVDKIDIIKSEIKSNVVMKFGRYRPDLEPRFDNILCVTLASSNQHAEVIA